MLRRNYKGRASVLGKRKATRYVTRTKRAKTAPASRQAVARLTKMVRSNAPELNYLDSGSNFIWGGPSLPKQMGWLLNVPVGGTGVGHVNGKKYFTKSLLARISFSMPHTCIQTPTARQALCSFRITFVWDKAPNAQQPPGAVLATGPDCSATDVFQTPYYGSGQTTINTPLNLDLRDRMQILGDDVVVLGQNGQAAYQYERYIKINKESVLKNTPVSQNRWADIMTGSLFVLITPNYHGCAWDESLGPVHQAIYRVRYTDA